MAAPERSTDQTVSARNSAILTRIDLVAIAICFIVLALLTAMALVWATIDLVRLLRSHWSNPVERWGVITFGVSVVWISIRWKKTGM